MSNELNENENEIENEIENENEIYVVYSPYDPEFYQLTRGELKFIIVSNICFIFLYIYIIMYSIHTSE